MIDSSGQYLGQLIRTLIIAQSYGISQLHHPSCTHACNTTNNDAGYSVCAYYSILLY